MAENLSRYTGEALEFILQLKESVALEVVAVFLQTVSKRSPTSGLFPLRGSSVPGLIIAASEHVTTEAAQQGGNWADNRSPGCGIHK